jgi:CHAT domain-containing protein/tetratricopeptide (TPR) repeat protein
MNKNQWQRLVILSVLIILLVLQISPVRGDEVEWRLRRGREAYDLGRYAEVIQLLTPAITHGSDRTQAIIHSNLSLAYQQLGNWQAAQQHIQVSLQMLSTSGAFEKTYAQALDIHSRLWYMQGKPERALASLKTAAPIYTRLGDTVGSLGNAINQAQVLQALGLYQQAYQHLEQIRQSLMSIPDSAIKAQGYLSLGNVLLAMGELKASQTALQQSLASADNAEMKSAVLLSLANMFAVRGNLESDRYTTRNYHHLPWQCEGQPLPPTAVNFYRNAATHYQQALSLTSLPSLKVPSQINYLHLLVATGQLADAEKLWQEIKLTDLPNGRQAVYTKINAAKNLACLAQKTADTTILAKIDGLLKSAVSDAREIADNRALSYALGNRGGFYEYLATSQAHLNYLDTSQKLTQQALLLSQTLTAADITYQWEWQMGRILAVKKQNQTAIAYYQIAVDSLKSVRQDLLGIHSDVQLSYRDRVEPVYRGLVDLLLSSQPSPQAITQAIANIDALQLAELQNFLRCDLRQLLPKQRQITNNNDITANTAFIYPIILEDRLEVIYKFPGNRLKRHRQPINRTTVQTTIQKLRQSIFTRNASQIKSQSQVIYDWLIKPLEIDLENYKDVNTLIFALDGELRNIPMGLLYDKTHNQYLIEKKYALALVPSWQLFDLQPQPQQKLPILAAGVSEKQENLSDSPGETSSNLLFTQLNIDELYQIAKMLPSKLLINDQFTPENLFKYIQSGEFPIVHIATHGNFSSDPEDTYLLAYGKLIKAKDLDHILRNNSVTNNTIKLLVLSACQTAVGDHRAILGLAGMAVRAGAKSTLSTLWQINDDSTAKLMVQFYTELQKDGVTTAEALHRAQKALLTQPEYQNPYYWSAYVLVGNWW